MNNHKAVIKTPKPLRNFQVYKGDPSDPKSMKPFCEPCMNQAEARTTIRQDASTLPPSKPTMYFIHIISDNKIAVGSIQVFGVGERKAA